MHHTRSTKIIGRRLRLRLLIFEPLAEILPLSGIRISRPVLADQESIAVVGIKRFSAAALDFTALRPQRLLWL